MSDDLAEAYRLLIADVYELAGRSRRTSEEIARRHGRTAAQGHVLSVLSDEELTAAAVARRLGLSPQAVHRVVRDLTEAGQVRMRDNPGDARAPLVRLTAAGRRSWQRIAADTDAIRSRDLAATSLRVRDLERARATLRTVLDALPESQTPGSLS